MYKLKEGAVVALSDDASKAVFDSMYDKSNKDYHYLAFDRQLSGFCPIDCFVRNQDASVREEEEKIFDMLLAKREVCSLYPRLNLTLYPLTKREGPDYEIDLGNIDKHFKDILELNDKVYKTEYLVADFGHGASNFDQDLILKKLNELLKKSKLLKEVYIEYLA